MTTDSPAFSVEDFLEAITSQLDRTQDALRLKAVNRPLTYAIRDFSMDLKVHVELGADGRVLFRPAASDDAGASVVHIGFTTVNRTMIDENTVSLSSARSPSLDELGLDDDEKRRLERLGVRNAAQLDRLKRSTGEAAVARFSGLPVSRLRQAMAQGRPTVRDVRPADDSPRRPPPPGAAPAGPSVASGAAPVRLVAAAPVSAPVVGPAPGGAPGGRILLPNATRRVLIGGHRLDEVAQDARLDGRALSVVPVDGGVEVDLGDDPHDGTLELDLGQDGVVSLSLEFEPGPNGAAHRPAHDDPWRPS